MSYESQLLKSRFLKPNPLLTRCQFLPREPSSKSTKAWNLFLREMENFSYCVGVFNLAMLNLGCLCEQVFYTTWIFILSFPNRSWYRQMVDLLELGAESRCHDPSHIIWLLFPLFVSMSPTPFLCLSSLSIVLVHLSGHLRRPTCLIQCSRILCSYLCNSLGEEKIFPQSSSTLSLTGPPHTLSVSVATRFLRSGTANPMPDPPPYYNRAWARRSCVLAYWTVPIKVHTQWNCIFSILNSKSAFLHV